MIVVKHNNAFVIQFRSQITVKILNYFFINPARKPYLSELAALLKVDRGNLFRKLAELSTEGLLTSEFQGKQKYFSLNKNYPLLKEIKKTFEFKYGLEPRLKVILSKLEGLKEVYLFGSYANNSLQQESDIDILLVGTHSALEAKKLILPLQNDLQREINIIDFSPEEFKIQRKNKDEFLETIFSRKIIKLL